ncbi:MAG: hypothetical protein GF331_04050 [Chitinivibrionales bacterium]|nr:hypothetical protein [Chitinivibrionales bacterium]
MTKKTASPNVAGSPVTACGAYPTGGKHTAIATVAIACLLLGLTAAPRALTVTIDAGTQHQTIEAFGACEDRMTKWRVKQGPFYTDVPYDGQWDTIAGDLGMTAIRMLIDDDFDQIPAQTVEHVTQLHARGIDLFWSSILSPPAYMKDNGSLTFGGELLPEYYDDFAAMVVSYCNNFKTQTGVDLWGISLQNELMFVEPYASCIYTPTTYKAVVEVVVPAMRAAGLSTKLLGAEHMLWGFPQYEQPLMNDPATDDYIDRFILHSYLHDVNPIPADQAVQDWQTAAAYAAQQGKGLWMTETSGYDTTWSGGLELASYMYVTLKHGKASGWIYLGISSFNGTENCLLRPYGYSPLGVVSKHYYRFIRPGMVMLECTDAPGSSLFAVAFRNQAQDQYTVVLLNTAASAQEVTIGGGGLPASLDVYQSTESMQCKLIGTSSGSVSCPARSITTLTTGTHVGNRDQTHRSARAVRPAARRPVSRLYSLDGRLAGGKGAATSLPSGVYVSVPAVGTATGRRVVTR